jgi:hypothetical protein
MFVAARNVTRRFFGVRLFTTLNWVNFGECSSVSSFRHGVPEPRFTLDVSGRITPELDAGRYDG